MTTDDLSPEQVAELAPRVISEIALSWESSPADIAIAAAAAGARAMGASEATAEALAEACRRAYLRCAAEGEPPRELEPAE